MRIRTFTCGVLTAWITISTATGQVPEDDGWMAGLKEKFLTTEFEFSRADSDVPFLPVLSIGSTAYGKTDLERMDGSGDRLSFRTIHTGGYGFMPLHVGQRDIVMSVPYISHTKFLSTTEGVGNTAVDSFYCVVGGAWQTENKTQWGGFLMPSVHSPFVSGGEWAQDLMGGVVVRQFSGDRTVWYYGFIYDYSFGGNYFYPYLGYSYQVDRNWLVSLVLPWPTVSYAPSKRFLFRAGVVPSGATWTVDKQGEDRQAVGSFGGWDLGVSAGWRLTRLLWLDVGTGFSGLRSIRIDQDGEVAFEQKLGREPYISVSLNVRPDENIKQK